MNISETPAVEIRIDPNHRSIYNDQFGCEFTGQRPVPFATPGSCGIDLRVVENTYLIPDHELRPHNLYTEVDTGVYLNIQSLGDTAMVQIGGLVLPRSGAGSRGIYLANTVGLIDTDYQGEIILRLRNRSSDTIVLNRGERVAQLVFFLAVKPQIRAVEEFSTTTERGEGGFGHTGVA